MSPLFRFNNNTVLVALVSLVALQVYFIPIPGAVASATNTPNIPNPENWEQRLEARLRTGITHQGGNGHGRGALQRRPPLPAAAHVRHGRQEGGVGDSAAVVGGAGVVPGLVNVLDYGAKGDNVTDNTQAFNAAIAACAAANGGIVYAPPGGYHFAGSISLAEGCELRGSYDYVPSHDCRNGDFPSDGTVLRPTGGRGNSSDTPFITVPRGGAVRGLVIFHSEQDPNSVPAPYPFAIKLTGNNAAVTDVELLNAFNGISAIGAHRHYIARIQGQPLNIGVMVDETYDIGRIEDVHFNPWYSCNKQFLSWQVLHGRAFVLGRSDWEYMVR